MTRNPIKSILPKGLYGRAAMILLVPVITIQLVVSVVFIQRHFDGVTRQMSVNIALDVELILNRFATTKSPRDIDEVITNLAQPLGYVVTRVERTAVRSPDLRHWIDLTGRNVIDTLRDAIPSLRSIDLVTSSKDAILLLETPQGSFQIAFDRSRISASAPHQLLVVMIAASILMTLISILFLRNQVRPIRRLARVAEAFGRGQSAPYRVSGATEVRAAGQAFLDMRNRIERHIEQRTLMLSGVSHDLRTPLTRLKLGLSLSEANEETAGMIRDVDDMELMLDEFLAFARGDTLEETQPTDIAQLAEQVAADATRLKAGLDLVLAPQIATLPPVSLRPNAVKRALDNLISNAARYGNRSLMTVSVDASTVFFTIEDNGPGIPPNQRDLALRPFIRLDEARNQDHGTGVGLGLSIVMDIASSHGGALELLESAKLGGLKVIFALPR